MIGERKLKVVGGQLPEPPYLKTPKAKANGYGFDIDVAEMMNSDYWVLCPSECRPWMVFTWIVSWAQYPCGTLPNDDELISARMGCTIEFFRGHRDHIMRGWVLHSDDRFYHKMVTEKVQKMLGNRKDWAEKKKLQREKKEAREKEIKLLEHLSPGTPQGVPPTSPSYPYPYSSTSKKEDISAKADILAGAGAPAETATDQRFTEFWSLYPRKTAKKEARKAWGSLRKAQQLDAIEHVKGNPFADRETRFIPHPATYLRGERWEDQSAQAEQPQRRIHYITEQP